MNSLQTIRSNRPMIIDPRPLVYLPDEARSMGLYLLAGKGSGKSRLMGRVICWQDLLKGVPGVILDPNGPTIDNLLDKIARAPPDLQAQLWPRIRYIDMSGKNGMIVPFPLYYRRGRESLYEISQRYLEVLRRIDPNLLSASIEGWNALSGVGTPAGMILAATGNQITEAVQLLSIATEKAKQFKQWEKFLGELAQHNPETQPAVDYLLHKVAPLKPDQRTKLLNSFLNKVEVFQYDAGMKAMFGANSPGIDWEEVVAKRQIVCMDFRHELTAERRRFKMLWAFRDFLEFIKQRGAGRHQPISFIVDELTALYNFDVQSGANVFAADLDETINVIARNYRLWLTLANQELFQIDEKSAKTLLGMGSKIIGVTTDMEAALTLAKALVPVDPYRVKRYQPIYAGTPPQVIDYTPVEWTIQEQQYVATYLFTNLRKFRFLVKLARGEGDVTGTLRPLSIENIEPGIWVDEQKVAEIREVLAQQSGVPIAAVLAEIEQRQQGLRQSSPHDTLAGDGNNDGDLSELRETVRIPKNKAA